MKILLIDNHVLFREGLSSLLEKEPDIMVVGESGNVPTAARQVEEYQPDIVIIDIGTDIETGLVAIHAVFEIKPDVNVVLLMNQESDELLVSALRLGVKGFINKNSPFDKLLASIRGLSRGEAAISRTMTRRALDLLFSEGGVDDSSAEEALEKLTRREVDVLRYLSADASNRDIAEKLFISENTVKVHVHNILEKLQLNNRREAGRYARTKGLVIHSEEN